ncbi:unnamed protein product (macronuclear) [Paramecium tetraurelia]|uniref:Centrosomal protein of 162 kDa n=1 Tax=Paramecium tetraurelia TaxID=5888 RepID=A0E0X0_PARTE|nr:uncharacterized protein GSPATT00022105001 [Paramecium tetraurelia]CAK88937.1 unnamed protein product [Paramecium tetraurelia]|eukprot:XP_001456334.1 hypothetical protein (macronuclear) [Paramecium tetraurelia strain d4-2]
MFQKEQRNVTNSGYQSTSNAYVMAMKALQEKIKVMETQRNDLQPSNKMKIKDDEILIQQIQELRNQNESLSIQLQRQQNDKENINNYILQIEALQQERLIQLKEYQDRIQELIQKVEDGKKQKCEMQNQIDQLQKQLEQYKINERGYMHKLDQQKLDENQKQIEQILDLKHKVEQGQQYAKKLEKRYERLQNEKNQLESNYIDYKERCPAFKLQEYEKQIQMYRSQLEEKERIFLKMMEEIQDQCQTKEDQLTRRIQELLKKSNEQQSTINKLTTELKDLNLKHQQLQLRLEYEEKNNKFNRQRMKNASSFEDQDVDIPNNIPSQYYINYQIKKGAKLNGEQFQNQFSSPLFEQSLVKSNNVLKQAIKDCLEDMKQTSLLRPESHLYGDQSLQQQFSKNKRISPPISSRNNEIDNQLKQLNNRYEQLLRQAQRESDFKLKAQIRKELLDIAEQIKELNRK